MKEKKCVCVDVCAHVCVCVRVGLVLRVDGESCGSYILSQWPAGAYLDHRVWDTLSFQNINPKPSQHTHIYTHMPAKAMSRLEPVCKNSILHTMFPCRNPFTVFSSSAPTVSEKQKDFSVL